VATPIDVAEVSRLQYCYLSFIQLPQAGDDRLNDLCFDVMDLSSTYSTFKKATPRGDPIPWTTSVATSML